MNLVRWLAEMLIFNPLGLVLGLATLVGFGLLAIYVPWSLLAFVVVGLFIWWVTR